MPRKQLVGDGDTFEVDGLTFRCRIKHDPDMGEPWKEHDGHGLVSDWTRRPKEPGELVMVKDRDFSCYYDVENTIVIALRDGWGVANPEGKTKHQIAAEAVQADFERMKGWCEDDWTWIGVCVQLLDVDGNEVPGEDTHASLWGIESDSPDYHDEVAHDLAEEIAKSFPGDTVELRIRPAVKEKV